MNPVMEKELETLINSKRFDELSIQQKKYVLENITEEEYTAFFDILVAARQTFEEDFTHMHPKEEVKVNLSQAFQNKHKKSTFRFPVMNLSFRNPAFYKLAFILSVVVLSAFFFLNEKTDQPTHTISKNVPAKEKHNSPIVIPSPSLPPKEVLVVDQPRKTHTLKYQFQVIELIDFEEFLMSTTRIIPQETTEFCSTDLNEQTSEIDLEDFMQYTTPMKMDDLKD